MAGQVGVLPAGMQQKCLIVAVLEQRVCCNHPPALNAEEAFAIVKGGKSLVADRLRALI
jgi:hypothetical protein